MQAECEGTEEFQGKKKTEEECANSCRGISSLFIYGTNEFGLDRCDSAGCSCFCELPSGGECIQKEHKGFKLYKYGSATMDKEGNDKFLGIQKD